MVVEREVIGEALTEAEMEAPAASIRGRVRRKVLGSAETCISEAGQLGVERTLHKDHLDALMKGISAIDLRVWVVNGFRTPLTARQALWVVAQMRPGRAEEFLQRTGNREPSESSLDRPPKAIGEKSVGCSSSAAWWGVGMTPKQSSRFAARTRVSESTPRGPSLRPPGNPTLRGLSPDHPVDRDERRRHASHVPTCPLIASVAVETTAGNERVVFDRPLTVRIGVLRSYRASRNSGRCGSRPRAVRRRSAPLG